mmetsp:Transcript_14457/g.17578  ORF Transcript_14457/g.17578 Transcript_14457/m.17578 type:complete len:106 (-) Transcript_14457:591-908(-)
MTVHKILYCRKNDRTLRFGDLLFQFLVAMHEERTLVGMLQSGENKVPVLSIPEGICLKTISSIRAVQGDPTDAMNLSLAAPSNDLANSCWQFRADSVRVDLRGEY